MKLIIIALVTLAALSSPILTFACPPPPAPGYDGGEGVGEGPAPVEGSGPTNPGMTPSGDDSGSSSAPGVEGAGGDVQTTETCM